MRDQCGGASGGATDLVVCYREATKWSPPAFLCQRIAAGASEGPFVPW